MNCVGDGVHENLIQSTRLAHYRGHIIPQLKVHHRPVLDGAAQDNQGRLNEFIQLGLNEIVPVHAAEDSQPFDNFRGTVGSVFNAIEELVNFLLREINVELGQLLLYLIDLVFQRVVRSVHGLDHADDLVEVLEVPPQRLRTGSDKIDGVIQLMGNARRQLTDGGQLLRLDQLLLGGLKLIQGRTHARIDLFQIRRAVPNTFFQLGVLLAHNPFIQLGNPQLFLTGMRAFLLQLVDAAGQCQTQEHHLNCTAERQGEKRPLVVGNHAGILHHKNDHRNDENREG